MKNIIHLLHLTDPSLPIGGFSHSAGLETYVQEGIVHDTFTAKEFVMQQLSLNIHFTDAAILSLAFDAAALNNMEAIFELDELCQAVKMPAEIRLASNKLGTRLLKIYEKNNDYLIPNQYYKNTKDGKSFGHYCIAFGLLAKSMHSGKEETLSAFYYNAATGFVTNAVKLIPLGQQDGQEILMSLFPLINELVHKNIVADKEMIGYCCAGFDIRSMQHEQLYSRLYMS